MLVYSLSTRTVWRLMLSMAAVLAAYSVYYAALEAWLVVTGAMTCALALAVLGSLAAWRGTHPPRSVVVGALVAINVGATVGITALGPDGPVWLAPLVFVNFLLGGIRGGGVATLASMSSIIVAANYFADPRLALNVLGAIALSLLMASAYGNAVRKHLTRLESEALHDPLTGLLNRRALPEALEQRRAVPDAPIALVFLDLDHFKQLNDRLGHSAGDLVLQRFAEIALAQVRKSDSLFRFGGEEFLILLQADADDALRVAEKVRQAVAAEVFPQGCRLTVSAGVTRVGPGEPESAAMQRADAALYAAKSAGRNRCAIAAADGRVTLSGTSGADDVRETASR